MNKFLKYKKRIEKEGIGGPLIAEMIAEHREDHERMKRLYERYKADVDGPAIFRRSLIEYGTPDTNRAYRIDDKVNNHLNNAFDADIVDTKVGYLFGHPISYDADDTNDQMKRDIADFILRNNIEDADSECGKMATICGYAARLAYVDREGQIRVENIEPWETILIGKDMTEPDYALRYYKMDGIEYAEFYDRTKLYEYSTQNSAYSEPIESAHLFDYVPLFGVPNNKELKGDAEKVLELIDAYDRTLSDVSNEIEQYRLAYLVIRGMGMDDETVAKLKSAGVFELFGENDDVRYLTKDINDTMIENHLNRLEENILRFAKSVNFGDESFGGNITGVAMRFKLLALENKCITMERKFSSALRYQFKVLFSAWAKRKDYSKEDYLKVFFSFKRNLPANLLDEAQTTTQLQGRVSERTRLGLLSFVDDVDFELQEMEKDALRFGNELEPLIQNDDADELDEDEEGSSASRNDDENTQPCPTCSGSGKVPSNRTGNQIQCPTCKGTGVRVA